ncbi:MAG: hypothetical protein DRN66_03815 [Candidatus Nanohalarchaeota archaeon]|nr:MAG: hypothetical protein DRN66_03815 [Candidatus Nanohaloarchaeota archaeon]
MNTKLKIKLCFLIIVFLSGCVIAPEATMPKYSNSTCNELASRFDDLVINFDKYIESIDQQIVEGGKKYIYVEVGGSLKNIKVGGCGPSSMGSKTGVGCTYYLTFNGIKREKTYYTNVDNPDKINDKMLGKFYKLKIHIYKRGSQTYTYLQNYEELKC